METTIGADAAKLAGLQIDLLQKMRSGHIALSHLEWFNGLTKEERDQLVSGKVFKQQGLLRKVATIQVLGTEKFVVKDCFEAVNIGWRSDNFQKLFLNKVEENVGDITIAVHRLERRSLNPSILAELGNRAEIKLTHFFGLLKKQSKGENGALLTRGYGNIAYIKDNDGNLWAVQANWFSDVGYWHVYVYSVEHPFGWSAGTQVLSCDS